MLIPFALVLLTLANRLCAEDTLLLLDQAPRGELAIVRVDFTSAVQRGDVDAQRLLRVQAYRGSDDAPIPAQFVPVSITDPDSAASSVAVTRGMFLLKPPPGSGNTIRLAFDAAESAGQTPATGQIKTSDCTIDFDPLQMAGLPAQLVRQDAESVQRVSLERSCTS